MSALLYGLLPAIVPLALGVFSRSQACETGNLQIAIDLRFSGEPLVPGSKLYHTANGDSLYLDAVRFYLTNIQLRGETSVFEEPRSYHLIDAEENASQIIVLKNVPAGNYETISFYIGTDSLTNVSGAMDGDLDPAKGMYWAWNSGYINIKLEGRSNACNTLHHAFEFHIGGYKPPHQTVRHVALPLKKICIAPCANTAVKIRADLEHFFNRIQLEKTHQVMIPGKEAVQLADWFKEVFHTL